MPQVTDLIIFDCDGVLVDSERIAIRTNIAALAEYGHTATEAEIIEQFVGKNIESIQRIVSEWVGDEHVAAWTLRCRELYYGELETSVEPVDGILEALAAISIASCVASSGTQQKMRMTLGRTGLYDRFAGRIFSAADVANGKPAPDLFLHAARQMGVAPQHCVVVEDSEPGVQAARAAGMRCFGYTGGVTPAHRLAGPGTVLFDDMRKLPALLEV
ncbi:haloacid dehalogenase [Rhizocola hellebori]|uniref:Haloacid dehalogenase n=1 Tax=Rhizocola hellebori TaxID=1392758 RepID=A0A8J3VKR7_9ACTN|nr:haloacid dehalogenase [Rhizocola hellebori]